MNASELATKMLEWENIQRQADALKAEITETVLQLGKTQTVGNVRATYSNGRGKYDYETACAHYGLTETDLLPYSKTVYDYRKAAVEYQLDVEQFYTPGSPTVTVKILD